MEGSCPNTWNSQSLPPCPADARREAGEGTGPGGAPGRRRERRGAEAGGAAGGGGGDGRCAQARLQFHSAHSTSNTHGAAHTAGHAHCSCTHSWARSLRHTAPTVHTLAHMQSDGPHSQYCPPQTHVFVTICSHSPAAPGPLPAPAQPQPQPPAQSQVRNSDRQLCPSRPVPTRDPRRPGAWTPERDARLHTYAMFSLGC